MILKRSINRVLRYLGYEIHKISDSHFPVFFECKGHHPPPEPAPIAPIWPLPHPPFGELSDEDIRAKFGQYDLWHYAYEFEGGLSFSARHNNPRSHADSPKRPLQRFGHFIPYLISPRTVVSKESVSLISPAILDFGQYNVPSSERKSLGSMLAGNLLNRPI